MSRPQIAAIAASVVGIVLTGLLVWQVMENGKLTRELSLRPAAMAPAGSSAPETASGLAAAFAFLPNPSQAVAGREIAPGKFWVWVKIPEKNEQVAEVAWQSADQSWFVDVGRKEARLLASHEFGFPYGPTVSHAGGSERYFYVHWAAGWEGSYVVVEEYIDRTNGQLAYSLTSNSGTELVVASPTRSLNVEFSPVDACVGNDMPPAKSVTVTGLDINGTVYPFPQPRAVECIPSEFHGRGFYPAFEYFVFSEGERVIRMGFPWSGAAAEIPADSLDPTKIEYLRW